MAVPGPRRARLRLRAAYDLPVVRVVEPADGRREPEGPFAAHTENERLVNSAAVLRPARPGSRARDRRVAGRARARHARRSASGSVTGASRASATGVARSRSSTARTTGSCRCRRISCRLCCPRSRTSARRASRRWRPTRSGSTCPARSAAARPSARPRRWTRSSTRRGTSCATATPTTTRRRSIAAIADYWMPVDQYVGGIDHATGHLLYSRFFIKVLNDLGMVGFREPFAAALPPGLGAASAARRCRSRKRQRRPLPTSSSAQFGADAVRLYILFMGPADQDMEWTLTRASRGSPGSCARLWRVVHEVAESAPRDEAPTGRSHARRTRRSRR